MEVKEHKPQTEGLNFPKDWRLLRVQDVIADFFCGPSPTCEERNIQDDNEWGVLKTTAATRENGWDWTKHKTLPRAFWNKPQIELKKGDLIVTKAGPRHRVGVAAWIDYVPPRIIPSGKMIALRPHPDKVVPLMLAAAIAAGEAQAYLNQRTTGMAESQVNFENSALLEAPIHLPLIQEQRAIETALSDVDGLLGGLDRLIAKKRDLKQAALQQLLTGQTRLPGFSGEWEVKRFGDVAQPRLDRINPRSAGVQEFCVELEHIASETGRLLGSTSAGDQASLKSTFRKNDVLFGKLRAYLRKYWLADCPGVCSTEIWVLAPKAWLVTSDFLFQIIRTEEFIDKASNSYGTHMPRSDWNIVKNYELQLPPITEQLAICEVLTELDSELAALEQRREKTRALKQAMMQELLTGRTRLV